MAAARRQDRFNVGAGDSAFNEVSTRNIFHRSVVREEGTANTLGWFFWTCIWMSCVAFIFGPAIALAWAIYGAWYWLVPRIGRMKAGPLLGAAFVVAVVGIFLLWFRTPTDGLAMWWSSYVLIQLVVGLGWAAWMTYAYGWQAVKTRQKASAAKLQPIRVRIPSEEEDVTENTAPSSIRDTDTTDSPVKTISVSRPTYTDEEELTHD